MSYSYKPAGILASPPHKSKLTGEKMRFSTLAGLYQPNPATVTPTAPTMVFTAAPNLMPPPPPSPLNSSGMMVLQGHVAVQVVSRLNPYARREIPAEAYAKVKRLVKKMKAPPSEKSLKYKAERVLRRSRRFLVGAKQKALIYWRVMWKN